MWKEARLTRSDRHDGRDHNTTYQRSPAIGLDSIAVIARRNRGEEIHDSECSDEYWYRVISGAAKYYVVLPGGRRQILDLAMPNDCFCSTPSGRHYGAVEAVVNGTVVACYARRRAEALAESDPNVARAIRDMALDAVSRMQDQLLTLGRVTAREKVGSFLIKMTERSSRQPDDRLLLFTSRYDIADYLALSVETVSRSLTDLRHRGFIALTGPRPVKIVDRSGLEEGDSSMRSHQGGTFNGNGYHDF
jgi:CRP/FNR family nitrogen fixation transcriptional regulator